MRLDRWFSQHFPELPHGVLCKWLRTGQVRLDGRRTRTQARILAGQHVRLPPQLCGAGPRRPPSLPEPLNARDQAFIKSLILYEDEDIVVIDKPAGLAVQGGSGIRRDLDGLMRRFGREADIRPRLVHRLDRETSGVLVVAKRRHVAAQMAELFRNRSIRKIYWAVVHGVPSPAQGRIDAELIRAATPQGKLIEPSRQADQPGAQHAVTHYAVIGKALYGDQDISWMSLKPVTGRQHQLRVHMAMMGHSILGDRKYASGQTARTVGGRLHLHARRIVFSLPGKPTVDVTAPLPGDLATSWRQFGFDLSRNERKRK